MRETRGHIKATEGSAAFGTPPAQSITWSMTAKAKPHEPSEFESVLLAIAGHDLRQPLQVLQNAREFLGRGVRTRFRAAPAAARSERHRSNEGSA